MNRRMVVSLWCLGSICGSMIFAPRASAGPLPVEELKSMFAAAEEELAELEMQAEKLRIAIDVQTDLIDVYRRAVNRCHCEEYRQLLREARDRKRELEEQLKQIEIRIAELREHMDWIKLQLEQWEEMEKDE